MKTDCTRTLRNKPTLMWDFIKEYRMGAMVRMELKHASAYVPKPILEGLRDALKVVASYDDQLVITTCIIDYIRHGDVRLHTSSSFVNTYILDRLYDMYDNWLRCH